MALYSLYLCCNGTVLSSLLLVPYLSLRTGILYAFQRWTVALPLLAGLLLLLLLLLALSAFLHLPSAAQRTRGPVLSPAWPWDQLPDPQALFLSAEFLVICSDYILCLFSRLLHFALGLGMPSSGYQSYLYRHLHSYLHSHLQRHLHICSFCLCWQFWQGLPRTISVWLPCCGDWWVVLLQTSLCVHIAGWRSLSLSQCFPGSPTPSSPMHSVESSLRLPPRFPLLLLWCSSCLS